MSLRFHPGVQRDINEVLDYYSERSVTAADRFWDELHECFRDITENPKHFSFINPTRGLRRIRLRKFPYLVIFYESANEVKVTCVKHEKRHPLFGMKRR